ncbi:GNAT family N-acetyltransferase [bacterium]|nr:GNAT family N-acetyltransferase [bacterium]MBU1984252.1 GNAT family N-acetyltransferase [bacterium]
MANNSRFPRRITCRQGLAIEVKPLLVEDIAVLRELHRALSESERALLREDVLDPHYESEIKRQITDEHVYRLVAWHKGKIIASVAMHRNRRRWMRHTTGMRVIVHPDYRRHGVALVLMEECIPYAQEYGIEKLYMHIMPAQQGAINLAKQFGFHREATLRDHVKDKYGSYHDIRVYAIDIQAAARKMEDLLSSFHDYCG